VWALVDEIAILAAHLAMTQGYVGGNRFQNNVALFLRAETKAVVFTVSDGERQSSCEQKQ
jgi:hypothetical protein